MALLALLLASPQLIHAQGQSQDKPPGAEPVPEPAVPAILALFDKYEVVGLPHGHGLQDLDDFIFALIRNPVFAEKVNDIEFECGDSLYQPVIDRYIAGEDVAFTELQKVWRMQPACGASEFVEEFFPLVRALNQKLPAQRRLRVLAGDPPVDWSQIKGPDDVIRLVHRDASIASVMEKEVLSRHRKALMLFGTFHLLHGAGGNAVSIYEKDYPGVTFIVSDLGIFDTNLRSLSDSKFSNWPVPALARAKGTWLGAFDLGHFLPPGTVIREDDCSVHREYPKPLQKPMETFVDAFLYLGPQDLRRREKIPADIALDASYRSELQKGSALLGFPNGAYESAQAFEQEIVKSAENPIFAIPEQQQDRRGEEQAVQGCLRRKNNRKSQN